MSILEKPFPTAGQYIHFLAARELPVRAQSVRGLEAMRASSDSVTARDVAAIVLGDPLFAVKVIVWLERHRHPSQNHDITTLDRAILMIGVEPFFRAFEEMPTIEEQLSEHTGALAEASRVADWAREASHLARECAILRHDIGVGEVALATLLRPLGELLLWVFAPTLAEQIRTHPRRMPGHHDVVAQKDVLGCSEREILLGLAHQWHLPELLISLMDEANGSNPRVRTVALSIDFARHLAQEDWSSAALPGLFNNLAHLLPVTREQLFDRLAVPHWIRPHWQEAGTA